jgi:hypothetical protein
VTNILLFLTSLSRRQHDCALCILTFMPFTQTILIILGIQSQRALVGVLACHFPLSGRMPRASSKLICRPKHPEASQRGILSVHKLAHTRHQRNSTIPHCSSSQRSNPRLHKASDRYHIWCYAFVCTYQAFKQTLCFNHFVGSCGTASHL